MHKTAFSYYGGKGKLAHKYPAPKHNTIIEPFAGGAAYSLRYFDREVHLYDTNPHVIAIWEFLQSDTALDYADVVPTDVTPGDCIDDIIDTIPGCPQGLEWLLRSAANVGQFGTRKRSNAITFFGAKRWACNTISKIRTWTSRIQHWRIKHLNYWDTPDITATWFIDPPYSNRAGAYYRYGSNGIDYSALTAFVHDRRGQVIVCENEGANWLDFEYFSEPQGTGAKHVSRNRPCEVIYHRNQSRYFTQ